MSTMKMKRLLSIIVIFTFLVIPLVSNISTSHGASNDEVEHSEEIDTLHSIGEAEEYEFFSDEPYEAEVNCNINSEGVGLVGFEGKYELVDDNLVSVIVLFYHQPAAVQVLEAQTEGYLLEKNMAEQRVEDSHTLFRQEISNLFHTEVISTRETPPYEILWEYRIGLNGVNIVLPSNKVHELASLNSVGVVYPDFRMRAEKPIIHDDCEEDYNYIDIFSEESNPYESVSPLRSFWVNEGPWGMRPGRTAMRANEVHALGYRGEGVLVAVLDSGIDYHHPAFEGAFLTLEEMQARGANISYEDTIDGVFYGRNFFPDERAGNDPMEEIWFLNFLEFHGTHVSGTIVGRENPRMKTPILGVAPEANLVVYRVFGTITDELIDELGMEFFITMSHLLAAFEQTVHGQVDVVNMSIGLAYVDENGQIIVSNEATQIVSIAINNIMLHNPYMVFVSAAGNFGHPYRVSSPATAAEVYLLQTQIFGQ